MNHRLAFNVVVVSRPGDDAGFGTGILIVLDERLLLAGRRRRHDNFICFGVHPPRVPDEMDRPDVCHVQGDGLEDPEERGAAHNEKHNAVRDKKIHVEHQGAVEVLDDALQTLAVVHQHCGHGRRRRG